MTAPASLVAAHEAKLTDSRFTVPGMRCAGCIAKIERGIAALDGVAAARVNFSARRLAVRHDARLGDDAILGALQRLGFEAQPAADNPLAQDDGETKGLLRALAVAGFGMMNIMLLSVAVWSGAGGVTREVFHYLTTLIALPVIAYAGRPFFASAAMALRYRRTNMDVPISIGVLLASGMSFHEVLTGGRHAYFDGVVMLLFFLLAGRAMDAAMRSRTRAGIGALWSRMGKSASVVDAGGAVRRVAAENLCPGMVMLIAAGEALAADGTVTEGVGALDNSMLTGESAPEAIGPGRAVHAGAIALAGPFRVAITATQGDTALAEIARLMDEAGQSRSRYVRIADRAARLYAPVVHALALLAFAGWMLAGAGWHQALTIAIAVLIITCPCAIGLAVPAAQVVASGALLKRGLLIKDGSALERLAEIDIALFDKTGTLTLGEPRADIADLDPDQRSVALALAQASRHPLSRGLAASLREAGVTPADVTGIVEIGGESLAGFWRNRPVALERPREDAGRMSSQLRIGQASRTIGFADPLRSDAHAALRALARLGVETRIVSGDRVGAVEDLARELGAAGLGAMTPAAKLELIEGLRAQGRRPLMVGDGLNDGPALAAAHASIAPGTASDISQQAADAVFVGSQLAPVVLAVRVARATAGIVRQNFTLAILYNLCAVPLALAGLVTPLIAAVAMSLSSLLVVGNSLRLARAAA